MEKKIIDKIKLIKEIISCNLGKKLRLNEIRENLLKNKEETNKEYIYQKWKNYIRYSYEPDHNINLYIHIPFCESKCGYCREDSVKKNNLFSETNYINYILESLDNFKNIINDTKLNSVHIGGGTPSILTEESIKKLLKKINEFNFKENAERTFEFNPSTISLKKLDILKENGINRISFGIQSTNNKLLQKLGRNNPSIDKIKEIIDYSKILNFELVNVDLILGLVGEDENSFLCSLEKICELKPKSIYIYPLELPNNQYLKNHYNNDINKFKNEIKELYINLLDEIIKLTKRHGYISYSKTTKENVVGIYLKQKNNFSNLSHYEYISREPSSCIGIGMKSRSRIFGIIEYREEMIEQNNNYKIYKTEIDLDFEIITFLLRCLMAAENIELSEFKKFFKVDFISIFKHEIDYLKSKNLIEVNNKEVMISNITKSIVKIALLFLSIEHLQLILDYYKKTSESSKVIEVKNEKTENQVKVDVSGDSKSIMVSRLCNNKCLMCHSDTNYAPDYTSEDVSKKISECIDGTENEIQISGGEPTMRKDLVKILENIKLRNKKARIQINSNGRMFAYKEYVDKVKPFIKSVTTEIHGHTEEIHDEITQVDGSFKQTLKGIKNLLKEDIEVNIVILVNKINYNHLEDIARLIKSETSGARTFFHYTWFENHAKENKDRLFIKIAEIPQYLEPALDILKEKVNVMHYPLCIFKQEYHKYIKKQNFIIDDRESYPSTKCEECKLKPNCRGVWSNYVNLDSGLKEFIEQKNYE